MTSLRGMTVLVETGMPDQKYQHNAYVSKTHAAHVLAMLRWADLEPENNRFEGVLCIFQPELRKNLIELRNPSAL